MVGDIILLAILNGFASVGGGALVLLPSTKIQRLNKLLTPWLAGVLLATAMLDILPDILPYLYTEAFVWFLVAVAGVFVIEFMIGHWDHTHTSPKSLLYSLSISSVIHNIIFGILIAAFATNIKNGFLPALLLAFSDIPHEMGIFGVLRQQGFTKQKSLLLQVAVTLPTIVGAIIGYQIKETLYNFVPILLALLAGWFFYIAVHELLHDVKEQTHEVSPYAQLASFVIGILLVAWILRKFGSVLFGFHPIFINYPT